MVRRVPGRGPGGSLSIAGGDSFGGATPPISDFFEDKPAVEIMNLMGFDAEALGNHNFDRGEEFLRSELIPRLQLADPVGERRLPGRRDAAGVDEVEGVHVNGVKLGVVGFTTEATPSCSSRAGSARSR